MRTLGVQVPFPAPFLRRRCFMEITIGRTVLYRLNEFDAAAINHKWGNGAGNRMYEGEILPVGRRPSVAE
jgi:hypothetical protein